MTPRSGRPKWRLQSLPPEGEVAARHVLRHDVARRVAHDEDDAQVADERPDDVALAERVGRSDRRRLLAERAVEAADDLALAVEVDEPLFDDAVQPHEAVELELLFAGQVRSRSLRCESIARGALDLLRQVVLGADVLDLLDLGLEPVDVLFLGDEDPLEERPRAVVALLRREVDPVVQALDGVVLEVEVDLHHLGHGLADVDLHVLLHVRDGVEVEDPVHRLLGVLHLADRLLFGVVGQAACSASCAASGRG